MVTSTSFIREIVSGKKTDWKILVRVIRMWFVPDKWNLKENAGIEMVFIDEEGVRIQASIKKMLIRRYKELIKEGSSYIFQNFFVVDSNGGFRATTHKFKLNFMGITKVIETSTDKIPSTHFQFATFDTIKQNEDESLLFDIIGHVVEKDPIKDINIKDKDKKSKLLEIVLQDLEKNTVRCTLWEAFAERMDAYLLKDDHNGPIVVILQFFRTKTYLGKTGLSNALNVSNLLINPDLKEVLDYKDKLDASEESYVPSISQLSSQSSFSQTSDPLQTDRMTIDECIEANQECVVSVLAKVMDIEGDNWWYHGCSKCSRKVEPSLSLKRYFCVKCKKTLPAVPRFRIQMSVIDDTGSASFVIFDRIATQLIGKSASDLLDTSNKDNQNSDYPSDIDGLINVEILFQVSISDRNVETKWPVYTVKTATNDEGVIQQFRTRYSIKLFDEEDEIAVSPGNVSQQVDDNLKDLTALDDQVTPTSKSPKKRECVDVDICDLSDDGATQRSSNKILKKIKIEKD
ncbi:hypothetical protein ABFS82_05G050900 [Erythranthe guttata]